MSAPSFASFPPSFSSFPDEDPGPSTRKSSESKSRKDDRKHHKDRDGREHRDNERKRRKDKESSSKHRKESHGTERTQDEEATRYFYSDKRGDQLNVQYGGLYKGDVPKYKTVSCGQRVLGLPSLFILNRTSNTVEVGTRHRPGQSLTDAKTRRLLMAPPTRRLVVDRTQPLVNQVDIDADFVRLTSGRMKPAIDESYRSITRNATNSDSEASEASGLDSEDDDSDGEIAITLTSHQEAVKALEREIAYDPSSVSNWLRRVTLALAEVPLSSPNAQKSRAEITLSIVERAFTVDPINRLSVALHLKYLRAAQELMSASELKAKWETAYQIGGTEIWMEWLHWKLRNDGIDCAVDAATRVLGSLGDDEEKEVAKVRVLGRVATEFRLAGFVERANALFQAQAELTFQVPRDLYGLPLSTQLEGLEEFWDSEAPRMGETGSQGWTAWLASGKKGCDPVEVPPLILPATTDRYQQWARQEAFTDVKSFLPTRAVDEEGDDWDPFAAVLFTDLRPLVLNIQTPAAKNAFRLCWLSFLGLHIPGVDGADWDDRWCYTHATTPTQLGRLFPMKETQTVLTTEAVAGVIIGRERQYAMGPISVKSWSRGVFDITDDALHGEGLWGKLDLADIVDQGYVRRLFEQLRLGSNDWEWDALSLAFEGALNVKSAIKVSRKYLSEARDSLPHWAAHARLERRRGKADDARKIYTTVLSARPSVDRPWTARLWWDWAEMEWLAGQSDAVKAVILKSAGVEASSGVGLLRAKRNLEEQYRRRDTEWKDREAWLKLRALLEDDIIHILAVLDAYHVGGVPEESLTVATLLIVYNYGVVLKMPTPPSILRERAARALRKYPSNSVVLELFLEGEKGQGVWGRVRESLSDQAHGGVEKDLARRLQDVWVGKWLAGQADQERTRRGLAAAVMSERTRGSAILWRVYIEFEIRASQLEKAKNVLLSALSECPTVKSLYLLAFDALRSVFTRDELQNFVNVMAEKGLRVRQELELQDERVLDKDTMMAGSETDSDSEIEENANELRRLMPY